MEDTKGYHSDKSDNFDQSDEPPQLMDIKGSQRPGIV